MPSFLLRSLLFTGLFVLSSVWAADDPIAALAAWDHPQGNGVPQAVLRAVHATPVDGRAALAGRLAALLASPATAAAKGVACDALAIVGDAATVPALAPLLQDPALSPRARNALLALPDAVVLPVLRTALDRTTGRVQAGIVTDLGQRRDAASLTRLAVLAAGTDVDVARAAINALGDIGSTAAHQALSGIAASAAIGDARTDALLAVAERLAATDPSTAAGIVRPLTVGTPIPVRSATWRLLLLVDAGAASTALAGLGDADARWAEAMVGVLATAPGTTIDQAMAKGLASVPDTGLDRALTVLVRRRSSVAAPAVASLLVPGVTATRRVALLTALGTIGGPDQLDALVVAMTDADGAVAVAARDAVANCPHPRMPDAIRQRLATTRDGSRIPLALAGAAQRVTEAVAVLIPLAVGSGEPAETIRTTLGRTAGPAHYETLARLVVAAHGDEGVERMWSEILKRSTDREAATRALLAVHDADRGPARMSCMRLLGIAGTPAALAAVAKDLDAGEAAITDAAVRVLADWPEADAVPHLLAIATRREDQTHRTLALRGLVRLAIRPDRTTGQQIDLLRQAWTAVKRPDDAKLLLGAVGRIPDPAALVLLEPHLADAAIQEEVVTAWLNIARALDKAKRRDQAVQVLDRLIAATNGAVQERARAEKDQFAGNGKGRK